MNTLVFQVLTVLVAASSPAASENTLLDELVKKGVAMPDGQVIPLRAPMMAEDLDAAGQAKVLAKVAALGNTTVERILDEQSNAAITLKTGKYASQKNGDIIRTVNLYFVVRGDWEVLTGKQFVKGILKAGKAKNSEKGEGLVSRAGYIEAPRSGSSRTCDPLDAQAERVLPLHDSEALRPGRVEHDAIWHGYDNP